MALRFRIGFSVMFLKPLFLVVAFLSFAHAGIDPAYTERLSELRGHLASFGFESDMLDRLFSDERVMVHPEIVGRTGKGFNYLGRQFGLLTKESLRRGRDILRERSDLFHKMEQTLKVEKEIVVAILRIETNFGRNTGNRSVFNSLLTFALVENRRSQWAAEELTHLLRLSVARDIDPLTIKGSWAGAFGLGQFIPSSCTYYGMDGDGNGVVDLFEFADAVWSIANYLRSHGWEAGHPEKKRKAVWAYNHCDSYVIGVFAYAKALKRHRPAAVLPKPND
jgi:membrane-bound lytic murein transglycosylase B